MKKYFVNEDGTIKVINMVLLIAIILVIAIVFIVSKFFKNDIFYNDTPYTTKEVTSKLVICDDCSMKFTEEKLVFNPYSEYSISAYMETKNINVKSIKFEIEDESLFSISNKAGGLTLTTKNKLGKTTLTATYDKIKISVPVEIELLEIRDVDFLDHPYYVYNGKLNDLELVTDPIGVPLDKFNITIENTNIAELQNGKILGKSVGQTKMIIDFNDEVITQDLYVFDDLIHIKSGNYQSDELYNINISDIKDGTYEVIVTIDDNLNIGYTNEDLFITHEDVNTEVYVEYDGKNVGISRSYKYKITLNNLEDAYTTIKFSIGTTTFRILTIGELKEQVY